MKYILGLTFLVALVLSLAPTPNCTVGSFWNMLPITPNENVRFDLDDLIKGYNVDYKLDGADAFNFVKLKSKLSINKQQTLVNSLKGLKSYKLDHLGNEWGEGFIALTEVGDLTMIHYGLLAENSSAPVINNEVRIEDKSNVTCFDAVLVPEKDLVIVDCAVKNSFTKSYDNVFYYVKLSQGELLKVRVSTETYVGFSKITRRRLNLYNDPQTGYHYLLRNYFADGVDPEHSANTYIDVFIISDPFRPWTLKVIDRSLLHQPELSIVDIKMYLGDIFLLDNKRGLYRMDITTHQQLIITGFYEAKGFNRFAVYANDLDSAYLIALANSHSVYEVDWSDVNYPVLLAKYSLIPNTVLEQVQISENYLVVQSYSNVSTATGPIIYNYTWIFNRGDRTYTKAFKILNHASAKTFVDLNRKSAYLMVIDEDTITNYAINRPHLTVAGPNNETLMNTPWNFTVRATSSDPNSKVQAHCNFTFNFTLVYDTNTTIWPSGYVPPEEYSVNYPGRLQIPLFEYVLGPNVTYEIKSAGGEDPPDSYVLQQEQLNLHWEHSPGMVATRFLKTEQFVRKSNETLIIYLQDVTNITYVAFCETDILSSDLYCNETYQEDVGGEIIDWATTEYYDYNSLSYHHITAYTTNAHTNTVFINDFTNKSRLYELVYPQGYEGAVSSIEITANYLFVVQKYIKTILVYDFNRCAKESCNPIYKIDHKMMYDLGVRYFNPQKVFTSTFHPEVIFIQTSNSLIILDVDREGVPILLTIIDTDATKDDFKVAINWDYMLIARSPSTIEEYELSELYEGKVFKTKNYPLYGYKLAPNFDLDISDQGDTIYFSVIDSNNNSDIFVYRAGYPNVGSLYDVVSLSTFRSPLVEVAGAFVDFLVVAQGTSLKVFKQFELPIAVVENSFTDHVFEITYSNDDKSTNMSQIKVAVQNWPMDIEISDYYKDIMHTKDILYSGKNRFSQFDPYTWYKGHVLRFEVECQDCKDKVTVKNHITLEREIHAIDGLQEYQWGFDGGSVQQQSNVIHMQHNGSIDQIVNLPQATWGENCIRIAVPIIGNYHVSACQASRGVNLYVTSFISSKGFSWGPYPSAAKSVSRIEVINELVMLVDTDSEPHLMRRAGGIFIYAINIAPDDPETFIELDYLDSNDFGGVTGWDDSQIAYIANAEMSYIYETNTYRVIMTEMTKGLFVVDFAWGVGRDELTILNTNFIDLQKVLLKNNYHMPYDASFQAVTVMRSSYNTTTGLQTQWLLVTTHRFHTFQFEMVSDKAGAVVSFTLIRAYLRYAFYEVSNYIRHFDNYMVVAQVLPPHFEWTIYNKQVLTVYDTSGDFNGTVTKRNSLGAFILEDTNLHSFDFNWTFYNRPNGSDESRVGLVLVDRNTNQLRELSLHKNITVETTEELDTQVIYLDLINDFSREKLRIYMHGRSPFPEWKIVLIVLSSITGLVLILGGAFIFYRRWKVRNGWSPEESVPTSTNKESLLSE